MADEARMPAVAQRPKRWLIEFVGGEVRIIERAKLHSTAEGWIKFIRDDGRVLMFVTVQILGISEEAPE